MLGNVATQFEETLEFDPIAMKITNSAEADALLRCEQRQGWTLYREIAGNAPCDVHVRCRP